MAKDFTVLVELKVKNREEDDTLFCHTAWVLPDFGN